MTHKNKPYIKKICEKEDFEVWLVEGKYIRDNIDEEFTNFGQHYRFRFIPKNEFWIDKEHSHNEKNYYIKHLLTENRLMSLGSSYEEARKKADTIELKERKKSEFYKKIPISKIKNKEMIIKKIHKKLLKKYSKKISVWLVNGELVRDLFFVDFTEGGHYKVYDFIPKKEIWIDDDISKGEMKFILLHELHELNLMLKGKEYDNAHAIASKIEYHYRKNPSQINSVLKKEFEKL